MTDIDSILDNATQWATEGITKPAIKTGQLHSLRIMSRGIVVKKLTSDDELIGVVDRHAYSVNSHEIWACGIVSMTSFADLEDMIGVVKRIVAEYTQVADEETYLTWAGGDYKHWNNKRFEFRFAIIRNKALQTEF
jgi:hypothetical protein